MSGRQPTGLNDCFLLRKGPTMALSIQLFLIIGSCFIIGFNCTKTAGVPLVQQLVDFNFQDYYTGTAPETVIVTLFYAYHDKFQAPLDLLLLESVAKDYHDARYNHANTTVFGSFFYPPQNGGEAHWYPEPVPLPREELLNVVGPKPTFTVTHQETVAPSESPQPVKQEPETHLQKLLKQISQIEADMRAKLGLPAKKKEGEDDSAVVVQQIKEAIDKASKDSNTGDQPKGVDTIPPSEEATVEVEAMGEADKEKKGVMDTETFVSQNATEHHHDQENESEAKNEERQRENADQEKKTGEEVTQQQQQRTFDKNVKFSSAALYSFGKLSETFPLWQLPSFELFRISLTLLPGGNRTDVFQYRYGGFPVNFWLASFLKKEIRALEYFPSDVSIVVALRWLHHRLIIEEIVVLGLFAHTNCTEYSLLVQAANNYNQMLSFAAIHISPNRFIEAVKSCPDSASADDSSLALTNEDERKERVKDFRKMKRDLIIAIERRMKETKKTTTNETTTTATRKRSYESNCGLEEGMVLVLRHLRSYRTFEWEEPADNITSVSNQQQPQTQEEKTTPSTTPNPTDTSATTNNGTITKDSTAKRLFYWIGNESDPIMALGTDTNLAEASGYGTLGQAALVSFLDLTNSTQKQILLLRLRNLAMAFRNKINVLLFDSTYYEAFRQRLGLDGKIITAAIMDARKEKTFNYPYDDNFARLAEFCNLYLTNKLKPYRRSTPFQRVAHLDSLLGGVEHVSYDTFEPIVLDPNYDVIVAVVKAYCGICKMLSPIFKDLVETFATKEKASIRFAMYDMSLNDSPTDLYSNDDAPIRKFPTILFFGRKNKKHPIIYEGAFSYEGLHAFVEHHRTPLRKQRF